MPSRAACLAAIALLSVAGASAAAPKRRHAAHPAPAALPPGSHPGVGKTLSTSFGPMTIRSFDQTHFVATYPYHTGRIEADVQGDQVTGYWYQVEGGHPCDVARNGTKNWGRLVFAFAPDGRSFQGKEGYCDDEPDYAWNSPR